MAFQTVATVGELKDGDIKPITLNGSEMVLLRSGESYYATQRKCPHHGADLNEGIVSRGFLICSLHAWRFHVDSGQHELSPATCLATYAVRVERQEIQVDPSPRRP